MPAMGSVAEYAGAEGGLLERSAFLEALEEGFDDVAAGGGRLVLVSGEAGIGKSTLVRRFCETRDAGTRVLWGACDALGTPRPLGPLVDMAATLEGAFPDSVHEGEKPHAVFLALLAEVRSVRPTIAVIEDVHWADEATLDVIRLVARRAETVGALVLITYRESELEAPHPVRLAVGELGTAPGVSQLRLPPLSRDAVEELARPHGVDAPPRARSRRSPSSRRTSRCGCSTRSCRRRSFISTPAWRRACCEVRAAPCHSVTSSPGWPSSSRSDRTAVSCCTAASSRRCEIRPTVR